MPKEQSLAQGEFFLQLKSFAEKVPVNMYWVDLDCKLIGVNQKTLRSIGAKSEDVIGKTLYDMYPKHIAEDLILHVQEVIKTLTEVKKEHVIQDMTTKELRYYNDVMSPLFDSSNILIGVIGASIEITAEKQKEQLQIQNAVYEAELKAQKVFKECMNGIQHLIQEAKINAVSNKTGTQMEISDYDKKIVLTKREREILYFLSMGKTPKEIASLISVIEDRGVSYGTISAFINKQLYPKFNVFSISQLVEKATLLNLIPFLDEELL